MVIRSPAGAIGKVSGVIAVEVIGLIAAFFIGAAAEVGRLEDVVFVDGQRPTSRTSGHIASDGGMVITGGGV